MMRVLLMLLLLGACRGFAANDKLVVSFDRADGVYVGGEQPTIIATINAKPIDKDFRTSIEGELRFGSQKLSAISFKPFGTKFTSKFNLPELSTLDQEQELNVAVLVYLENGQKVDSYKSAIEKIDKQIEQLEGNTERIQELTKLKASLNEKIQQARSIFAEKTLPIKIVEERASVGTISVHGISTVGFNPMNSVVRFDISGAQFSRGQLVIASSNNLDISNDRIEIQDLSISIQGPWIDGLNELEILAVDSMGGSISKTVQFWAGAGAGTITVKNLEGLPVEGAQVIVKLADDPSILRQGETNGDGVLHFSSLPDKVFTVVSSKNDLLATGIFSGTDTEVTLIIESFGIESAPNLDFSSGADGWQGDTSLSLIEHDEGTSNIQKFYSKVTTREKLAKILKSTSPKIIQGEQCTFINCDLVLQTSGEGAKKASHTFKATGKNIKIRYRFQTDEFPTYYGSKYNDTFSVSVRTGNGGSVVQDSRSLNGLPASAYSAGGYTAWRELLIPTEPGDLVEISLSVSNVGDGILDSRVIVDAVGVANLYVSKFDPFDIDGGPLNFLSVGSHNYFGGNTRFSANVAFVGVEGDKINDIGVEILQNGTTKATVLATQVEQSLNATIGASGKVEGAVSFRIPMSDNYDLSSNGNVQLKLFATSNLSDGAKKDAATYPKTLANIRNLFSSSERYFERNESEGGDDWVRPSLKGALETIVKNHQLQLGDISNMNGGNFPPHGGHTMGQEGDFMNSAYKLTSSDPIVRKKSAQKIIAVVNDSQISSKISRILCNKGGFKLGEVQDDPFWMEIYSDPVAKIKVKPYDGHKDHFHVSFTP